MYEVKFLVAPTNTSLKDDMVGQDGSDNKKTARRRSFAHLIGQVDQATLNAAPVCFRR
jgi:hypothetical protein